MKSTVRNKKKTIEILSYGHLFLFLGGGGGQLPFRVAQLGSIYLLCIYDILFSVFKGKLCEGLGNWNWI